MNRDGLNERKSVLVKEIEQLQQDALKAQQFMAQAPAAIALRQGELNAISKFLEEDEEKK